MTGKKVAMTLRLSPEARQALERLAQQDERSMSSMVSMLIRDRAIEKGVYAPAPLRKATG